MMMGAALAGADKECVEQFEIIGRNVGMAFQIQDDILDCVGDTALLGKPLNSDEKNNKTTYVTLFGLDKAAEEVEALSKKAEDILESIAKGRMASVYDEDFLKEKNFLLWLIGSLVKREY